MMERAVEEFRDKPTIVSPIPETAFLQSSGIVEGIH